MTSKEDLCKKRAGHKSFITRLSNWFTSVQDTEENHLAYKIRLESLIKAFSNYCDVQELIEQIDPDDSDRIDIEDKFFDLHTEFEGKISSLLQCQTQSVTPPATNVASTVATPTIPQVRLPEIHIQTFTGEISEWTSFYQLFSALIDDNPSLGEVQKFMYLKSFLKNEPLKLIDTLAVTNQNYASAIDILKNRYENKTTIINTHLMNLLDIPSISKGTSQSLRDFVTNCKRNVESLKNLNLSFEELWNLIVVHLLERKLDFVSKKAFESEKGINDIPEIDSFFKFLDKRCTVLENLASLDGTTTKKSNVSLHVNNSSSQYQKCPICNESHKIYICTKFKGLQVSERHKLIKAKNYCFNCLGSGHRTPQCPSTRLCSICSQKHHSLLHFPNSQQSNTSRNQQSIPSAQQNVPSPNYQNNSSGSTNSTDMSHQSQPVVAPQQSSHHARTEISPRSTAKTFYSKGSGHSSSRANPNPPTNPNDSKNESTTSQSLSAMATQPSHVLLATASVYIYNANGIRTSVRCLLDNGSQTSFITKAMVDKLQLETYTRQLHISGISQTNSMSNEMIDLTLHSKVNYRQKFKLSCAVLQNISCRLPQVNITVSRLPIPQNISLADPDFGISHDIDLLIGAELYYTLLLQGIIKLGNNLPILQETYLGWIIAGNIPQTLLNNPKNGSRFTSCSTVQGSKHTQVSLFLQTASEEQILNQSIEKFWTIEELPQKVSLSSCDEKAERIFIDTTHILPDGRYQVDLPLKTPDEAKTLGESFYLAKKRFLNLENKFEKNPSLKCDYSKFIDDYIDLGHAKYVPVILKTTDCKNQIVNKYFLPHHAVFRENSSTSKIRVVFDGSCKTNSNLSLNDVLLKGFQVQPNLFDILCRFRYFNFVLTADIEKMYRQIKINPAQCFLLNILWRSTPNEDLKCIELSTVTYGTNCAPYLATRVLNEMANKNVEQFPLASDALLNHTYVDDIIYGCESQNELKLIYDELTCLMKAHGFTLHKWCSNSPSFLEGLSLKQPYEIDVPIGDASSSILGLKWNPATDLFTFSPPQTLNLTRLTKRAILSIIAQMYDPLGLVSCVIVLGKLIMQKVWLLKINWDTEINDPQIISLWNGFVSNIVNLDQIKIPRNLFMKKPKCKIQLHGFADASMSAYAACVYFRTLYEDGTISSSLVTSKSRVAPLKTISLPRLELCAMLLLAQLINNVHKIYENKIEITSTHLWTDSMIALCWIQSHASRWSVFVSNRVSQIQDLTSKFTWRHISSKNNPADLPSRGCLPQQLINCPLWFHGPEFLSQIENFELLHIDSSAESKNPDKKVYKAIQLEERKVPSLSLHTSAEEIEFWNTIFKKFSTFSKLQRVIAYCIRFVNNVKSNALKTSGSLSIDELNTSFLLIIKALQAKHFSREIVELKNNKPLSNKNLLSFKPFYCETDGLLRVGGRLENADIPFDQKHPILLPAHNNIVTMMLSQEHKRLGHAGAQTVLSNFRLRCWPLNGLKEIKRIIRSCIKCYRFRAKPYQQIMADLPKDRVQISRPFQKVGVDFGGPFLIKSSRLRKAPLTKCYISVFVCMVTKAVHIELVSSLSTEAFIACLKRFIARRGNPSIIYSDNGTNFQGAKNQLYDLYQFFKNQTNNDAIHEFLSINQTIWKFIPPKSPHWGGLWEAAIKSAKFHMLRLIGNAHLTFEELSTALTQIEAILNSRPLCPLSNDPSDLQSLTPGHFLIGTSLMALPERDITERKENRLSFWSRCTQLQQLFWKRWTTEYLNQLQNRSKWLLPYDNIKVNDLVLIKDNNTTHPLKWPLARVINTVCGPDGKVRMVTLKTAEGTYTRSIVKICPLPMESVVGQNTSTNT